MDVTTSFHFGIGMAIGTACALPRLARAWHDDRPLTAAFRQWFLFSYGLGLWAIAPNLLRRLGAPEALATHPAMNIFLLHPLINHSMRGGVLRGAVLVGSIAGLQYLLMLLAIRRARGRL